MQKIQQSITVEHAGSRFKKKKKAKGLGSGREHKPFT